MDSVSRWAGEFEFRVLGAIELRVDGAVADIGGARQRRILAALIARAGTVVGTDALVDMVWDDDQRPDHAAQAVRTYVSRLRRTLTVSGIDAGRVLLTEPPGYRLALLDGQLDSVRFAALIDLARRSNRASTPRSSLESLDEAMSLWRGEPYAEFSDLSWAQPEAVRLHELCAVALEERIAARLALGACAEVVGDAEQLVAADALRARPVELLLLALFRSDRQAEALRVAHRYRQALADVGLEPSANITELESRIAVADVSLFLPGTEELDPEARLDLERDDSSPEILALGVTRGDATSRTAAELAFPMVTGPFSGRDELVAEIERDLGGRSRVVTLTGPGGVGKTRVALAICELLANRMPITFVDLTAVNGAEEMLSTLSTVVGGPTDLLDGDVSSHVLKGLRGSPRLLVLDSCEHLVDAVATLIEQVTSQTEQCLVLTTSRESLDIPGEQLHRVPPLDTGVDGPAVDLFIELLDRAGQENLSADRVELAELCAHLDGLPLALELAAARCTALTPREILDGLSDRFTLLTRRRRPGGDRHRSLERTLEWSWDLLDTGERSALMQLAAFASSWTLAAMTEVLDLDRSTAVDLLDRLAAKSLLTRSSAGTTRFSMLECVRVFAGDRAHELGVREAAAHRHLEWVDALTTGLVDSINKVGQSGEAMARLDTEIDEIRAALNHASGEGDPATGLRVATRLWEWWRARIVLTGEGALRIARLLERADVDATTQIAALVAYADLLRLLPGRAGDSDDALREADACLGRIEEPAVVNRLELRLLVAGFDTEDTSIPGRLSELAAAAQDLGTTDDAMAFHLMTVWELGHGSEENLDELADKTIIAATRSGNKASMAHAEEVVGLTEIVAGRLDSAGSHLAIALDDFQSSRQLGCVLHSCESIAWLAIRRGDRRAGCALLSNCQGLRRELGRDPTISQVTIDRIIDDIDAIPPPNPDADLDDTIRMSRALVGR